MFREPSSSDSSKNIAPVKDVCAFARSTIRRNPTIRRHRHRSSDARGSGVFRTVSSRQIAADGMVPSYSSAHDARSSEPSRIDNNMTNDDPIPGISRAASLTEPRRRETGADWGVLEDASRYGASGRRLMVARELGIDPPSAPGRSSSDHQSQSTDGSNSQQQQQQQQQRQNLPFTPRFAPAVSHHLSHPRHLPWQRDNPSPSVPDTGGMSSRLERLEEDNLNTRLRWLRRIGAIAAETAPENGGDRTEPIVDGLGDRQRSLSPDNENDAWDTLLTTITTSDTGLRSAASFAGSDASRPDAARSPVTSSQALPIYESTGSSVPVTLEPYPEFINPCDYSESESESEAGSGENGHYENSATRSNDRYAEIGATMGSQPPIPTISIPLSRSTSLNPELQRAQSMLDRLSRRTDIPEDWWVALSRSVSRGLRRSDGVRNVDDSVGRRRRF